MKVFNKSLGLLLASMLLASCGGGGGSGDSGAFNPPTSGTLTLSATATTLPLNTFGTIPFLGSPFIGEVGITWRRANGDLVSGQEVSVSASPVSVISFSTLDDPTTQIEFDQNGDYLRGNEFRDKLGSGPVDVTGGVATIFVHSGNVAGTGTITVTARDPDSTQTISKTLTFTVQNATAPLPASISMGASPAGIYLQNTTGTTASIVTAIVRDGGGQLVPDPASGNNSFNNVRFEVIGSPNNGSLSGLGAGGATTGQAIAVRTVQGVAAVSFRSGTIEGPIQIRATVDRADNNVDNGVSDSLSTVTTVVVSDGKLFSLAITRPDSNALYANPVDGTAGPETPGTAPPFHNGTYSLTVSAVATDRQGNPVIDLPVRFGQIDGPMTGFPIDGPGTFSITGNDGNPQESGTLFTAPNGRFTTAGGGAGPGDTLLVFGDLVPGNRDLESSRTIASINNAGSLNVVTPFNRNDDTGNSVDNGAVIPYVIGRSIDGNIGSTGITDANGVASVTLNYPVTRIGKAAYVFAQGDAFATTGAAKKVSDIKLYRYPGMLPLRITASPTSIPGNATVNVVACLRDNLGSAIQGQFIQFGFVDLGSGSGSVDGTATSGYTGDATGADGCVLTSVRTTGISATGAGGQQGEPRLIFSNPDAEDPAEVEITTSGGLILVANPTGFIGTGGLITLTLRDPAGNPVPSVAIGGTCSSADVSLVSGPGVTNAQGQTTAEVAAINLNRYGSAGTAVCTFRTPSGETATVNFTGINLCTLGSGVSPPPPPGACPTAAQVVLTVNAVSSATCGVTVTSSPTGITCGSPAGG
ncbi:MAG TPA: hypothetical protein VJ724_11755, partial [Tahibacter sp.]|nr:hypothetical protein [Tahibacter sp.]